MLSAVFVEGGKEEDGQKKEEKDKKTIASGAGIGYTSSVGKVWDVNAYLKNKDAKN